MVLMCTLKNQFPVRAHFVCKWVNRLLDFFLSPLHRFCPPSPATNTVWTTTAPQIVYECSKAPTEQAPDRRCCEEGSAGGDAGGAGAKAGNPGYPKQGRRSQLQQQEHHHAQRHGPSHALVGLLFLESVRRRRVRRRSSERREHTEGGEVKQRSSTTSCLRARRRWPRAPEIKRSSR